MASGTPSPTQQSPATASVPARYSFDSRNGEIIVQLEGDWQLDGGLPFSHDKIADTRNWGTSKRLTFDAQALGKWDGSLLVFLRQLTADATKRKVEVKLDTLPDGVRKLLALADAVPPRATTNEKGHHSFLVNLGEATLRQWSGVIDFVTFLGEAVIALGTTLRGKARFRAVDIITAIQDCGPRALPIVSLMSFLIGLILAFVGAVQLQKFGAEIFVADLVGIAMTREMGAVMGGIIMAGRTGASFAAQLGTMTVNEEIDALRTMGLSPMEFLVVPRMIALALMMPLLVLYADIVGILGGFVVCVGMLDLTSAQYWEETKAAVTLTHISIGVVKGAVFGVLIALAGCLRGMRCGRSAADVGEATTSAVVTAIIWIIVIDAVFAVITNVLDI